MSDAAISQPSVALRPSPCATQPPPPLAPSAPLDEQTEHSLTAEHRPAHSMQPREGMSSGVHQTGRNAVNPTAAVAAAAVAATRPAASALPATTSGALLTRRANQLLAREQNIEDIDRSLLELQASIAETEQQASQKVAALLAATEEAEQQWQRSLTQIEQSCQAAEQARSAALAQLEQQQSLMASLRAIPAQREDQSAGLQREAADLQKQLKNFSSEFNSLEKRQQQLAADEAKVSGGHAESDSTPYASRTGGVSSLLLAHTRPDSFALAAVNRRCTRTPPS